MRRVTRDDWQTLLREASRLHAAGRSADAIAAYERLLAVNPDLADSWFNLGWLQRQQREYQAALDSYQRALDLGVARPEEVHLNRAAIYSDYLRQPAETEAELLAALEKNERFVPALLNLGNLREDLGERDGAREAYARVLEIDSGNALALARLAMLSLSPDLDQALAERLRSAIAKLRVEGQQAEGLSYALAALLDAAGRYGEAFAAAGQANAANRTAGGPAARYDRRATEQFVDRSIATFTDRPAGESGDAPLFICGMYRSGSTLAEQILAAHSRVSISGELDLITALAAQIGGYPEAAAQADEATVRQWRDFYLAGLPAPPGPQRVVTDKRPDNFLHIGLIKMLFPNAKIIHTVRNPLDNLLSLHFLHLDPRMSYALDLDDAVHWHGQYRRLMRHWQALCSDDILTVDYDRLVEQPREVIGEMLGFVGLDWEDSCLEFNRASSMVRTASVWQVRQPLYKRSSGRWRNYEQQLEATRRALEALAE